MASAWAPNSYPKARRSDHVDVYKSAQHGSVNIPDPYNWLEVNDAETEQWTTDQEKYTRQFLDSNPDKDRLEKQITENTDYAKFSAPFLRHDNRWYWSYNSGLQAQSVTYRSKDEKLPELSKVDGPGGEVFFDPNLLSDDGTAAISTHAYSKDGKLYAYGVSLSGSDFFTIYVRSTDEPLAEKDGIKPSHHDKRLPDEIRFVKFSSITWTHDSKGFFYQRYDERESHGAATEDKAGTETDADINAKLYYHRIGTPQTDDILILEDPEHPQYMWGTSISDLDGHYLEIYVSKDTAPKNLLWIADLREQEIGPNMKFDKLIDDFDASYGIVANDETKLYILTDKDAPLNKVITVDLGDAKREHKVLIPEDPKAQLEGFSTVNGDYAVLTYKRDVKDEVYLYKLSTGERLERFLPDHVGAAGPIAARRHSHFFISSSGFTSPGSYHYYDFKEPDESKRLRHYRSTIVKGLNSQDFTAEQVWYESKDGTKVPMFIVKHKSTPTDGTAPAIQYGYGGFSISIDPFFSPSMLTFIKAYGGVLAVANIRGGGEFGEEWHLAGTKERKVNCFDDFIAASQYLVDHKHAAKGKVAINGGSNGGLLAAASALRAPEGLLGASVAEVGVLDLLKFHKFTIGRHWTADYGDPDVPEEFDYIRPVSPLHNVPTDKVLPATLLLTADHDDRVVPLHSFKYAATLQHSLPDNKEPLLIRVDKKSGHGAGKSTEKRIKEAADKWGFVAQVLGLKWKDDSSPGISTHL